MDHINDRTLALSSEGLNVITEAQDAALWLFSLFTGFQEVPELPTRDQFEQFDWFCLS